LSHPTSTQRWQPPPIGLVAIELARTVAHYLASRAFCTISHQIVANATSHKHRAAGIGAQQNDAATMLAEMIAYPCGRDPLRHAARHCGLIGAMGALLAAAPSRIRSRSPDRRRWIFLLDRP
jgi:hypothetical protein